MIIIKGKEFSEETVEKALKAYCNFEEIHYFEAGDVANNPDYSEPRLIMKTDKGLYGYGCGGDFHGASGQKDFQEYKWEYIGKISDFINKKTIEKFLKDGKVL